MPRIIFQIYLKYRLKVKINKALLRKIQIISKWFYFIIDWICICEHHFNILSFYGSIEIWKQKYQQKNQQKKTKNESLKGELKITIAVSNWKNIFLLHRLIWYSSILNQFFSRLILMKCSSQKSEWMILF